MNFVEINTLKPGAQFKIGDAYYLLLHETSEDHCVSLYEEPADLIPQNFGDYVAVNIGTFRPVAFVSDQLVVPL